MMLYWLLILFLHQEFDNSDDDDAVWDTYGNRDDHYDNVIPSY